VKISDAIQIDVINRRAARVFVDQRKRRTGDFVFLGGAQTAGDAFREGGLPRSQIAGKQDQSRRFDPRPDLAPGANRLIG
jgi:hypothetical protein